MSERPPSREGAPQPNEGRESTPYTAPVDARSSAGSDERINQVRESLAKNNEAPATRSAASDHGHHEGPAAKALWSTWGVIGTILLIAWQGIKRAKDMVESGGGGGHGGGHEKKKDDHGHGGGHH